MNDLKVKVWDKDEAQWLPLEGDTFISIDDIGTHVITGGIENAIEHRNVEIVQYTGINDKFNMKIYEGDIIKHYLDRDSVGIITYGQYGTNVGFYVNWIHGMHKELFYRNLAFWASISAVAGNIFENSELLEG